MVKRGKKGSKKKGKKPEKPVGDGNKELSELDKEWYTIQIGDLQEKLNRKQDVCDELRINTDEKTRKLAEVEQDKTDIVAFLKKTLNEKQDEIAELQQRLKGLQQTQEEERESFKEKINGLQKTLQNTTETLTSEKQILSGKLDALEEFKAQREDLIKKFESLEQELQDKEQNHRDTVYHLEKKAVYDRERLKAEMLEKLATTAAEFRQASDRQLSDTVKRMMEENTVAIKQVSILSDRVHTLERDNKSMKEKDSRNRRQLQVLADSEKELCKRNQAQTKIIKNLTEKCKALQVVAVEHEKLTTERESLRTDAQEKQQMIKTQQSEIGKLRNAIREREQLLEQRGGELMKQKGNNDELKIMLKQAASSVKTILMEGDDPEKDSAEALHSRENMLAELLELLNTAKEMETSEKLPSPPLMRRKKSFAEAARAEEAESQYLVGDLGLVQRDAHSDVHSPPHDGVHSDPRVVAKFTFGRK